MVVFVVRPRRGAPAMNPARLRGGRPARHRLLIAVIAILTLVTAYLTVTALTANAAATLLSQGRPATTSSTENAGTPAPPAVDGNTATRWPSAFSDPQWIQVDLGGSLAVCQVVLTWEAAYATAYQIQTSTNGTTWTTAFSTTTGTGGTSTITFNATARYLRMNGTARATPYGYSLW